MQKITNASRQPGIARIEIMPRLEIIPVTTPRAAGILIAASLLLMLPTASTAQSSVFSPIFNHVNPLLHSSLQGYMGINFSDIDSDRAQTLHLHDTHGVEITLIDHDAPAAQAGLQPHDVLLQMNGQNIDNADALRKLLRKIPSGRVMNLLVFRDGNQMTITVEMGDRKSIERAAREQMMYQDNDEPRASGSIAGSNGFLAANGDTPATNASNGGFHFWGQGKSLHVGIMVEPLTTQMADYLGIDSGIVVKNVARKSEAELAGLKPFDVILKLGTESIRTESDWERNLRANEGHAVSITILRDKHQQTLTLEVDSRKPKS